MIFSLIHVLWLLGEVCLKGFKPDRPEVFKKKTMVWVKIMSVMTVGGVNLTFTALKQLLLFTLLICCFYLLRSKAKTKGSAVSLVKSYVKRANSIISYQSQAPELIQIRIISWQTL